MSNFADIVLIVHFLWVLAIIIPIPLILMGARRNWHWIRSFPLRVAHLAMIGIVAAEALLDWICPLTLLENMLRQSAKQSSYGGASFIEYWVGRVLYYDFPTWAFTICYLAVGLLIFILFMKIPPVRRARKIKLR
ncbi:MAG: DUF2784 domain-containing protein [Bdellovibrionia bacterium]